MTKSWLEKSIDQEAKQCFEKEWDIRKCSNSGTSQSFLQLKNTDQWQNFKKARIDEYRKQITHNVLAQLQGLKVLIESQGDK